MPIKPRVTKIEISHKTIIFTLILLISVYVLFQIRQILLIFFVGLILMGALNPLVTKIEKYKVPRWLAILIIYIVVFAIFIVSVVGITPPFVEQTNKLAKNLPHLFDQVTIFGATPQSLSEQFKILDNLPGQIVRLVLSVFQNLLTVLIISVITFYLLIEHKHLHKYSFFLFGKKSDQKVIQTIFALERRLGDWVRAQFLLMIIVGLLSYAGFAFLGLEYAVPLAIVAGLLELIPNIGPAITTVLAVLIGLTVSPLTALAALSWSFLVQQLENNFIVPKIMKETVGINPLVTIFSLVIGFNLGGVMGGILAIPIYLTIEVILTSIYTTKFTKPKKQ